MMRIIFRRSLALVLLVSLAACSTVQPVAQPRQFITAHTPATIWLTRTAPDPATLMIEGPRILGDTLAGFVDGKYMEMPFAHVSDVRARQHARGRTIALLVGMTAAVVGLSFVITGGHGSPPDFEEGEEFIRAPLLRLRPGR